MGRKSNFSLYNQGLATYDEGDTFDHAAAKGFITLHNLSVKNWAANRTAQGVRIGTVNEQA